MRRLYVLCFASLPVAVLATGSLLTLAIADEAGVPGSALVLLGVAILVSTGVLALALVRLRKLEGRRLAFSLGLFCMIAVTSLAGANFVASLFVPPWPARGLHGTAPALPGYNSWGQLDRERTVTPLPGVARILFVGDSFLEESTGRPLAARVEDGLDRSRYEVINLGVSATDPDEYFYRIKNIGLALRPRHCYLFFYTGNDLIQAESLPTLAGLLAPEPRDSLLGHLGLGAGNHLLTNGMKPFQRVWAWAGPLRRSEGDLGQRLARATDPDMPGLLAGLVDPGSRERIERVLASRGLSGFYRMLREPDSDLFRSYYLSAALWFLVTGTPGDARVSEETAFRWVQRAVQVCRRAGARFTLVMIPDAFTVDERMRRLWRPLADMQLLARGKQEAAERLIERATGDGIEVIDLVPVLRGREGTYLNMDGHWSAYGTQVVSEALLEHIRRQL